MIRKAKKKGVTTCKVPRGDDLMRAVHAICNELPIRQSRPVRHYCKNPETVRNMTLAYLDQSIFTGAFFNAEMIGFVKLVTDEKRTQVGPFTRGIPVTQ